MIGRGCTQKFFLGKSRTQGSARGQFVRYCIVGVVSNAMLYALYLAATAAHVPPKMAMSGIYFVGVLQTFYFNKRWSFRDKGPDATTLIRYIVAYGTGYALNYILLVVFVDQWGIAHQYVQGAALVLVAVYLFGLQRFWVYRDQT